MEGENRQQRCDKAMEYKQLGERADNPLLKSWFFGKSVQLYAQSEDSDSKTDVQLMREYMAKEDWDVSYFSSQVQKMHHFDYQEIMDEIGRAKQDEVELLGESDGLLIWSKFTQPALLGGEDRTNFKSEFDMYYKSAKFIRQAAVIVHQKIAAMSVEEFTSQYQDSFKLLKGYEYLFPKFFDGIINGQNPGIVFQMVASFIEKVLGDIYCAKYDEQTQSKGKARKQNRNIRCPKKLSDLLETPQVVEVLGDDTIFLLQCMIGPISGLNFRNLLWHGFVHGKDFHPCFTSFLLVTLMSLSQLPQVKALLDAESGTVGAYHHRALVDMYDYDHLYFGEVLEIDQIPECDILPLLRSTYFIMPGTEDVWLVIFREFNKKNYYECLLMLYPQFEHCLRRIFVCVNDCADRIFSAESDVLCTSLETLLLPSITHHTLLDVHNSLLSELGRDMTNVLYDMFVWKESPRLRNQISHGSADPARLSPTQANQIIAATISLCIKYNINNCGEDYISNLPESLRKCYTWVTNYTSFFHPRSIHKEVKHCHKKFIEVKQLALKQESFPNPHPDSSSSSNSAVTEILDIIYHIQSVISKKYSSGSKFMYDHILDTDGDSDYAELFDVTDYTEKDESQTQTLRSIISHCTEFCEELIDKFHKLHEIVANKTANDRQRKSFEFLKDSLPYFYLMACVFMMVADERWHKYKSDSKSAKGDQNDASSSTTTGDGLATATTTTSTKDKDSISEFLIICIHVTSSLAAAIKASQFKKAIDTFYAFLGSTAQQGILSPKERARLFANMRAGYLEKI